MHSGLLGKSLTSILQLVAVLSLCALAVYLGVIGLDFKWIATGAFTVLFFGLLCYRTRAYWNRPTYWIVYLGVLCLHVAVLLLLQRNRPMLSGLYYAFLGATEITILYGLILKLFR
jgi:hypothetical protein